MLYKHPWAHVECRAADTDMLEGEKKAGKEKKRQLSEQPAPFKMFSHLKGRLKAICL